MKELGIVPPNPEKREALQQYRGEVYDLVLKPCALRYVAWRHLTPPILPANGVLSIKAQYGT